VVIDIHAVIQNAIPRLMLLALKIVGHSSSGSSVADSSISPDDWPSEP
jgi:hypothetical protein